MGVSLAKYKHQRLFTLNNPYSPRLCPELAKEIGLNESIMLLQIEFWLATQGEERDDGHLWLRKTIREIQLEFPYWGTGTIGRILEGLISKGFIIAAGLDDGPGRSGRWIRFDFERLNSLQSIRVLSHSGKTVVPNIEDSVPGWDNRPYIGFKDQDRTRADGFNQRRSLTLAARAKPPSAHPKKEKPNTVPIPETPEPGMVKALTAWGAKLGFDFPEMNAMWEAFRLKHLDEHTPPQTVEEWGIKFQRYVSNCRLSEALQKKRREA